MKKLAAALCVVLLCSVLGLTNASGEEQIEKCYAEVPQTQWQYETSKTQYEVDKFTRERSKVTTTQHYSWTGGPRGYYDPPPWPSPSWQPNTTQEPHNNADYWFDSPLHRTGSLGNANWFYFDSVSSWSEWSEPVRYVPHGTHDEFVDVVADPVWQEHGNSYTSTYQRDWALLETGVTQQVSTGFVTSEWIDGTEPPDDEHEWVKVGDRNDPEAPRVPCDEQPDPETREVPTETLDCETSTVTVTKDTFETEYVLDDNYEWVLGEEVQTGDDVFVSERELTVEEAESCGIHDGGVVASCIGDIPYLRVEAAPGSNFTPNPESDVTIRFHNPDGEDAVIVVPAGFWVMRDGEIFVNVLWPGASESPQAWPGYQTNPDGTYTPVGDDNFGWTRNGVDVTISINPEFTVEGLAYPEATSECADPPPPAPSPAPTPPSATTPPVAPPTAVSLPQTGVETWHLVALGVLLVALGMTPVLAVRRR